MISLIPHLLSEEESFEKSHMAEFSNDTLSRIPEYSMLSDRKQFSDSFDHISYKNSNACT